MCDQCIFQDTPARNEICADCPVRALADYQALRRRWAAQFISVMLLLLGALCLALALVMYVWRS